MKRLFKKAPSEPLSSENGMANVSARTMKWLLVIAALTCAACGGAEKQADYATTNVASPPSYPSPSPQTVGTSPGAFHEIAAAQVESASSAESEPYEFSDESVQAATTSTTDVRPAAPQPPPPPPAPPKPETSPTDKKIANVELEHASDVSSTTKVNRPATSTAADQDVTPHKSDFLIYTAQITMAVYQVDPGLSAVEQIARDLGGYLAVRTDSSITIRVPRASFDEAIRRIGATGDVLHKQITAEDVTDKFVDMESRLRNAKAMRDRLQDLLQKANVKEAIEIQAQLGKVTEEIEVLEGQLKLMRDKIAYSSIAVNFAARGQGALQDMPLRLPFPWLQQLGLPRLMSLHE
jgi:hypothetical protein